MNRTIRLHIHGRVQGVGYRAWTAARARKLGLSGWVRNRTDGTVEAVVRGPEATVHTLVEACRRGPVAARVDRIDEAPSQEEMSPGFVTRPTV